jgi:hypothetical protein
MTLSAQYFKQNMVRVTFTNSTQTTLNPISCAEGGLHTRLQQGRQAGCSALRQIVKVFSYASLKLHNNTHQMNAELVSEGCYLI